EVVDQFVGQGLEPRYERADEFGRKRRIHQASQSVMLLAFLVEDPAGKPFGERALGHTVVRGPRDAALPQLRVLEQAAELLVAQDGDAVRRSGVPAALPRRVNLVGGDGERRISDVKRSDRPE